MADDTFKALVLTEEGDGVHAEIRRLPLSALPEGDVLVRVHYSSLNYKDGLAVLGKGKVVRTFPMVPGVDLAGTVIESQSTEWKPGDRVLMTGYGAGEQHWGGFGQMARVRGEWLLPVPEGLTNEQVMGAGTAGLTAMLAIMALETHGLLSDAGEVVVTGASGGVGGMAIALLGHLGYQVVASTGRTEHHAYLRALGAGEIIDRELLAQSSPRPLEKGRWAGAVDSVGGDTLAGLLRTMKPGTSIAACGNASGNRLETTVLPFILRGVNMLGIDSNYCPREQRRAAWERVANDLPHELLDRMVRRARLEDVPALSEDIVAGKIQGRVVIDLQ